MNVSEYLGHVTEVLRILPIDAIEESISHIHAAYQADRTLFVVGNGGSAAAASHLAQDLAKGVLDRTVYRRIRALSLTDNVSFLTALANDEGYDSVFAAQLKTYATDGDVLIAISASGRSPNILRAASVAKRKNMSIIGVTGGGASPLGDLSDIVIRVPVADVGLIEGLHAVIFHYFVSSLRARITGAAVAPSQLAPLADLQPL